MLGTHSVAPLITYCSCTVYTTEHDHNIYKRMGAIDDLYLQYGFFQHTIIIRTASNVSSLHSNQLTSSDTSIILLSLSPCPTGEGRPPLQSA